MSKPAKLEDFALLPKFEFKSDYLSDYFGIWSIYEPFFRNVAQRYQNVDLFAHVQSFQARQAAEARQAVNDRDGRPYELTRDGIAKFEVIGPMMKFVSSMSGGTSTVMLRQQINHARRDPEVIGATLRMDTPGGTVKGNESLARDIASFAAEKPIFAYIEDMCASAGVSVASQTTKRYAETQKALYGSMGTYGVLADYSGNAAQLGIKVHVIKAGDFKGMGEPGTEITPEQLAEMQRIINDMNENYLAMIAGGLGKSIDSIRPFADGRIIFANDAVAAGLINGVQTYEQTYAELVQLCQSKRPVVSQQKRSHSMADTQAATLAELKQKFPKSTAEWREKQLEAGATLPDAALNYATFVEEKAEADRQAHAKQLADAKAKADADVEAARAEAKGKGGSLGHNPIVKSGNGKDVMEDTESGDAVEDFNLAVSKLAGPNPDLKRRQQAIRQVANRDPELYQAYLLACNPGKKQQRMITEKLEVASAN